MFGGVAQSDRCQACSGHCLRIDSMGAYWLHDAPAALEAAGLTVIRYPQWETRSRASGGFDAIRAVFVHHTASSPDRKDPMALGKSLFDDHPYKPCGNIGLARDGTLVFGAAGAANTQGEGGPVTTSKGVIPKDQGNRYGIAIEADNNGAGELWSAAQLDAYVRAVAVLCKLYDLNPMTDVFAHFEWASNRKIDPAGGAGQFPYARVNDRYLRWDMGRFRSDVRDIMGGGAMPPDMSNIQITDPVRILDTREGTTHNSHKGDIGANKSIKVRPHGFTPGDADGVILSLTSLPKAPGFFTLYSGEGALPIASNLNITPNVLTNNLAFVKLGPDGTFTVYSGAAANGLIIDQVGWYKL